MPRTETALRALPGIGEYTAAAIAALAFGADTVALDGNLRRVLARVFDVRLPARSAEGERRLRSLAQAHLPPGRAADFNQALMDLGASICTPRRPACARCPLADLCRARELGVQEARPVRRARPATPHYVVTAAIIQREGRVLLGQRPPQGLLGGLWEFPGGKQQPGESLTTCLRREIDEELGLKIQVGDRLGSFRHAYTHFRVTLHAFFCQAEENASPQRRAHARLTWARLEELDKYPMGKLDRMISAALQTG
ncbi:MAG: NUDIX domain-containing protein [Anaerolineae bacterium]|nr:MAG: NUDIX domain-containing protein [Anaerolineae bacterium]